MTSKICNKNEFILNDYSSKTDQVYVHDIATISKN